jgi:hypothetical protein
VAGEDNGVIDGHGDFGGGEGDCATGIAELAHGDEGGGGEGRDIVNVAGSGREQG